MKKVITIGGGTGSYQVLQALKNEHLNLAAIVSMADNGGSTGILRDELGVLPPGDVRQCLTALSTESRLMRDLMNYRFESGSLKGHSFGNIFLSALEKVTGNFEKAVEEAGKVLAIKGEVIPATLNQVQLHMQIENVHLQGESEILEAEIPLYPHTNIYLAPDPVVNPRAPNEIMYADHIIIGPGGLYTSLIPNLLIPEIREALQETRATCTYLINLTNKKAQTPQFKASDYLNEMTRYLGKDIFEYIIINIAKPEESLIKRYEHEANVIENDLTDQRVIQADLLPEQITTYNANDAIAHTRAYIRHDTKKLQKTLMEIINA